jgi:hypothetical protein
MRVMRLGRRDAECRLKFSMDNRLAKVPGELRTTFR